MVDLWDYPVTAGDNESCQGADTACFRCFRMQCQCLHLRQGTDAASTKGDAGPRAEPEAQAHGATAVRTEANGAAREREAVLVSACGQRGARAQETRPAYNLSGGPGRTAIPAPRPLYARAGAMWPRM